MGEFHIGTRVIDQDGIDVIDDNGEEKFIPPDGTWEWEQDARSDAMTPEEFAALYDKKDRLLQEAAGGEA